MKKRKGARILVEGTLAGFEVEGYAGTFWEDATLTPQEKTLQLAQGYGMGVAGLRSIEPSLGVTHWLCADGRIMQPSEMTDQHKLNCIRLVANGPRVRELTRLRAYRDAPDDVRNQLFREWMEPTYRKRAKMALEMSPVLQKMADLLVLAGLDPLVEHPVVLTDYDRIPTQGRLRSPRRPLLKQRRRRACRAGSSR